MKKEITISLDFERASIRTLTDNTSERRATTPIYTYLYERSFPNFFWLLLLYKLAAL